MDAGSRHGVQWVYTRRVVAATERMPESGSHRERAVAAPSRKGINKRGHERTHERVVTQE